MMMTTSLTRLLRTALPLGLLLPFTIASLPLLAQSATSSPKQAPAKAPSQAPTQAPKQAPGESQPGAEPPIQFEVASVRPHQSTGDEPSDRKMLPGGRFVATATPVRTLLRIAFGTDSISGAP